MYPLHYTHDRFPRLGLVTLSCTQKQHKNPTKGTAGQLYTQGNTTAL